MRFFRTGTLLAGWVAAAMLLAAVRPVRADAGTGSGGLHQDVNGYGIQLAFPDRLSPGVTPLQVRITDAYDQPVTTARVQVVQTQLAPFSAGGHGASEADDHGAAGGDIHAAAEADPHTAAQADEHAGDAGHAEAEDAHAEPEAAHGHAEPEAAHAEADSHAEVDAHAADDAHAAGLPHTHAEGDLFQLAWEEASAAYQGQVIFFEAGQWRLDLEFDVAGQPHAAEFVVDVLPPDPGRAVLAAFAGLNVLILAAAAVLKRKSAAVWRRLGANA
jgi:hypothetical protein